MSIDLSVNSPFARVQDRIRGLSPVLRKQLSQLLDPSNAARGPVLIQDRTAKDSHPVYQKETLEFATITDSALVRRCILTTPNHLAPVMLNGTATKAIDVSYDLFVGCRKGSRIVDDTCAGVPFLPTLTGGYGAPFKSFSLPTTMRFSAPGGVGIPLHSAFGEGTSIVAGQLPGIQTFVTATRQIISGVIGSQLGFPASASDVVLIFMRGSSDNGVTLATEWQAGITTFDAAGIETVTTANFVPNITLPAIANSVYDWSARLVVPANTVGLSSAYVYSNVAGRVMSVLDLSVKFQSVATTLGLSMSQGYFSGPPPSGLSLLVPLVDSIRTSSLSVLTSNVTSEINRGGEIVCFNSIDCPPAECGVFDWSGVSAQTSAYVGEGRHGNYHAYAPMLSREYHCGDSVPPLRNCFGLVWITASTGQYYKSSMEMVADLICTDPLFQSQPALPDMDLEFVAKSLSNGAFMINCANNDHLRKLVDFVRKTAGTVAGVAKALPLPGASTTAALADEIARAMDKIRPYADAVPNLKMMKQTAAAKPANPPVLGKRKR